MDHGQVEVEYTDLLMEVDVVVDHQIWEGNGTVISGCGRLEKKQGSYVIQCEKMWKTWL